jgi:hypothetical protein
MYRCILVASKAIGLRQVETRLMNYPCRILGRRENKLGEVEGYYSCQFYCVNLNINGNANGKCQLESIPKD